VPTIQIEESTRLSLLTRDGAVSVEFTPALDQQHYAELFVMAEDFETEPIARSLVTSAAARWGRKVEF
jgi:hypothetical protein